MKKLLILIALLFATYMFADTNTSNTNNTNSVKTKSKKEQKPEKCKKRKYCKNMSNCEEAKFYLEVCKYTNLDKDGDGIPCENVCK